MTAQLTRTFYETLAADLARLPLGTTTTQAVLLIAAVLKQDRDEFDLERFLRAAGVLP